MFNPNPQPTPRGVCSLSAYDTFKFSIVQSFGLVGCLLYLCSRCAFMRFNVARRLLRRPSPRSSRKFRETWKRQPFWGQEDSNKWQRNEGKGAAFKGKGKKGKKGEKGPKGGGKTDGKSGKGTTGRTADGRLICYAYNNEGCDGNCGMVHCCQVRGCYGTHPAWKHWQEYFAKLGDKNKTD